VNSTPCGIVCNATAGSRQNAYKDEQQTVIEQKETASRQRLWCTGDSEKTRDQFGWLLTSLKLPRWICMTFGN